MARDPFSFLLVAGAVLALTATQAACGDDEPPTGAATSAQGGSGGTGGGTGGSPCADGPCVTAGIAGCAADFVDDDGVCRPALEKCPAGSIPKFDGGCVAFGIPDCAPEFVGDDGICRPSMAKCPADSYAVPQVGCVAIDGPTGCGVGTWGDIADEPGTFHVDAESASPTPDGSRGAPYATITDALQAAGGGGRIAIAAGRYTESLVVFSDFELVGRCPSMVTIDGDDGHPVTPLTVGVVDAVASIQGLRFAGAGVAVYVEGGQVELNRVVIESARVAGLFVANPGGKLTVRNTLVVDTQPDFDGAFGVGAQATAGAELVVEDAALIGNRTAGLTILGGASLALSDVLVEGTLPRERDDLQGGGLGFQDGSRGDLHAVAITANHALGVQIRDAGTSVTADGLLVEGTLSQASDLHGGLGIGVDRGAELVLTRAAILGNRSAGVYAADLGTTVSVDQTLIADTRGEEERGVFGFGIDVTTSAVATLTDSAIVRSAESGLIVGDEHASATVRGLLVQDTKPQESDGEFGVGITLSDSGTLTLASSAVLGGRVSALLAVNASVEVTGCLFSGVAPGSFTLNSDRKAYEGVGDGLTATGASTVVLRSSRVEGCARAGILYDESAGTVEACYATDNQFGLVLGGATQPAVDAASAFEGNRTEDEPGDADLAVPDAPAQLPPPP